MIHLHKIIIMIFCTAIVSGVHAQDQKLKSLVIESEESNNGLAAGTVLTVNGAMHISPDHGDAPYTFDEDFLPHFLLWVEKGIVSTDLAIVKPDDWDGVPDYVFGESYDLKSLEELEMFVKEHKHLPNILGVEEIRNQNHYLLHDMLMGQLQNIEELLLHTIEQEKKLRAQEEIIKNQGERMDKLQALIDAL